MDRTLTVQEKARQLVNRFEKRSMINPREFNYYPLFQHGGNAFKPVTKPISAMGHVGNALFKGPYQQARTGLKTMFLGHNGNPSIMGNVFNHGIDRMTTGRPVNWGKVFDEPMRRAAPEFEQAYNTTGGLGGAVMDPLAKFYQQTKSLFDVNPNIY